MEYYLPTILTGVVTVALVFWLMKDECDRRHRYYVRAFHTRIVDLEGNRARELYRSSYVIGRRKRRCDICLRDEAVAKVHAVLWHDGQDFRIAPCRDMELLEEAKQLPRVYVNGVEVPPQGVVLEMGDVIRMGSSRLMLEDTREGEDEG